MGYAPNEGIKEKGFSAIRVEESRAKTQRRKENLKVSSEQGFVVILTLRLCVLARDFPQFSRRTGKGNRKAVALAVFPAPCWILAASSREKKAQGECQSPVFFMAGKELRLAKIVTAFPGRKNSAQKPTY